MIGRQVSLKELSFLKFLFYWLNFEWKFDDMYEMEQYLQNESKDIDYTIVRPPRLTDQTLSSNLIKWIISN